MFLLIKVIFRYMTISRVNIYAIDNSLGSMWVISMFSKGWRVTLLRALSKSGLPELAELIRLGFERLLYSPIL